MLTLDQSQAILGDYVETVFATPFEKAVATWHRFVQQDPDMAAPIDATTRAGMIHNWAAREVRTALVDHPVAREVDALGFFAVAFGTNPLVRFKFLNGGRPSNVATDQQKGLKKQRYDEDAMTALVADGIPQPPTLLTCGYRLDPSAELTRVEIRCDYGSLCLWSWTIWGDEGDAGSFETIPLPLGPDPVPAVVRSAKRAQERDVEDAQ